MGDSDFPDVCLSIPLGPLRFLLKSLPSVASGLCHLVLWLPTFQYRGHKAGNFLNPIHSMSHTSIHLQLVF